MKGVFDAVLSQTFPGHIGEYKFHPERKWRFDHAWPRNKIALEIEGGVWAQGRHTRGAGYIGDMEKYNEAIMLGWRVIRVTPQQIKNGEAVNLLMRIFGQTIELRSKKYIKQ